ncbi:MAG: rhodanese-like domain-containing protein [Hyphomicrobiaceae bacterium]
MSLRNILYFAVALVAVSLPICPGAAGESLNINQATLAEAGAKTPEVSTESLRDILSNKSAIVIDTRSTAEFEAGHIPGAINLGVAGSDQLEAVQQLVKGDKAKGIVLYCNGPFCQASRRLGDRLADGRFTNVRRYQLGMPVWRALGGPTVVELGGVKRIADGDWLAVFVDARPAELFAKGSLPQAVSAPADDVTSGRVKKIDLPEDDFNRRIVLFGRDGAEARKLADYMAKRPWHNVMYFPGSYEELAAKLLKK